MQVCAELYSKHVCLCLWLHVCTDLFTCGLGADAARMKDAGVCRIVYKTCVPLRWLVCMTSCVHRPFHLWLRSRHCSYEGCRCVQHCMQNMCASRITCGCDFIRITCGCIYLCFYAHIYPRFSICMFLFSSLYQFFRRLYNHSTAASRLVLKMFSGFNLRWHIHFRMHNKDYTLSVVSSAYWEVPKRAGGSPDQVWTSVQRIESSSWLSTGTQAWNSWIWRGGNARFKGAMWQRRLETCVQDSARGTAEKMTRTWLAGCVRLVHVTYIHTDSHIHTYMCKILLAAPQRKWQGLD